MRQRLIQEHSQLAINERIQHLEVDNIVTVTHLSTYQVAEKYSGHTTTITIVVSLEEKLNCLKGEN
jgi:hypothetical protein